MMGSINNKKNLIWLLIMTIGVAALWVATVSIVYKKISQVRSVNNELAKQEDVNRQTATVNKQLLKNNVTVDELLTILPSTENFILFVNFIEGIAAANTVALKLDFDGSKSKGVKPAAPKLSEKSNKITFGAELNGSQNNLIAAIGQIENGKYFIDFNKIDYISLSDDGGLSNVKLQGVVYVKSGFEK